MLPTVQAKSYQTQIPIKLARWDALKKHYHQHTRLKITNSKKKCYKKCYQARLHKVIDLAKTKHLLPMTYHTSYRRCGRMSIRLRGIKFFVYNCYQLHRLKVTNRKYTYQPNSQVLQKMLPGTFA